MLVARRVLWALLFEWCAGIFGGTVKSRLGQLVLMSFAVLLLGVVLSLRWGPVGWAAPAVIVALMVAAARQVSEARDAVWRSACLDVRDPRRRSLEDASSRILAPTSASLYRLAEAVHCVRRARYAEAGALVPQIHRDLLRPEEIQLLDAVGAMVSMGVGSSKRAAQQAVAALPTGSEELDACLGRTVIADAWNDPARLRAIGAAWERAGVARGPLGRLLGLVRIRIDTRALDEIEVPEARELSDEARAIGDDELASELDARSRPNAYR
jgi:hypothetical protein